MRNLLLICLVCLFVGSTVLANPTLDDAWNDFKTKYGKTFCDASTEAKHKEIFAKNLDRIAEHNAQADQGEHSYWSGVNKFSDFTNEEFDKVARCNHEELGISYAEVFNASENDVSVPSSIDWRNYGYVTPVKNQGSCGGCWAFAATGALEGQHARTTGKLVSLSEQNLIDCSKPDGNDGCKGGLATKAYLYVRRNNGIDTEACYPYQAVDGTCHFNPYCTGATCLGPVVVTGNSEDRLQQVVGTVGPVAVALSCSGSSFMRYRSGIYIDAGTGSRINLAALVVGYGTHDGQDYWLVKNSWGSRWGEQGYIKIARNRNNQCGIASQPSFPRM